jgi:hypothetical protein
VKIWLEKVMGRQMAGLIPTDEESKTILNRLKDRECVEVTITRPRSVPMHRMYFGICTEIGKNQDPQRTKGSIDYELRIRAGHFDVIWIDDEPCKVPKRIAFDELTHDEWMELWPSLELAIRERFGDGYIQERAA